jgi:hypothetical protein
VAAIKFGQSVATTWSRALRALPILLILAACGGKQTEPTPPPKKKPDVPAIPLPTFSLSGQPVSVVPLEMIVTASDTLDTLAVLQDHEHALRWADSLIGLALLERAPEIKWVLPPELRKRALRAPGVMTDPDRMGQSIMRNPKMDATPDPLRSYLRSMTAVIGGDFALIPAAIMIEAVPDTGLRVYLAMVMSNTRTGDVVYRTMATGVGSNPARALKAAMLTVIPSDMQKQ